MHRSGRFHDFWRGDGWFVSWRTDHGFFLLAFRWRWRLRFVRLALRRRLYIGPVEIEWWVRP